jgi:hypothetical protein
MSKPDQYVSLVVISVYANSPEDALGWANSIRKDVTTAFNKIPDAALRKNKPNVTRVPIAGVTK